MYNPSVKEVTPAQEAASALAGADGSSVVILVITPAHAGGAQRA